MHPDSAINSCGSRWLAYCLHTRRRRRLQSPAAPPPLDLALLSRGVAMNAQESAFMNRLVYSGTPLRDVVGDALRLRYGGDNDRVAGFHVDCLRIGSTVKLYRGTQLYYEPARTSDEFVVVTLLSADDNDEVELDVVAHVVDQGFVGVVYPGYGLLWTDAMRVSVWQRLDDNDQRMTDEDDGDDLALDDVALASLSLTFDCADNDLPRPLISTAHRIAAMLPLLPCRTLHTLKIDRAVILRDDLECVLDSYPRLHTLVLDRCAIETLVPLVDAYRNASCQPQRARVTVLSLLGARDLRLRDFLVSSEVCHNNRFGFDRPKSRGDAAEWLLPLVVTLTSGVARDVMRGLFIDLSYLPSLGDEHAALQALAYAVESSSLPLTRLHVSCDARLQDACSSLLSPLRDVVLSEPLLVRCAVVAVLRMFRCASPDITSVVLALSKGSVIRTVTWDQMSEP